MEIRIRANIEIVVGYVVDRQLLIDSLILIIKDFLIVVEIQIQYRNSC